MEGTLDLFAENDFAETVVFPSLGEVRGVLDRVETGLASEEAGASAFVFVFAYAGPADPRGEEKARVTLDRYGLQAVVTLVDRPEPGLFRAYLTPVGDYA